MTAADVPDRDGGEAPQAPLAARFPRLAVVGIDRGYNGSSFTDGVTASLDWRVEVVRHPDAE